MGFDCDWVWPLFAIIPVKEGVPARTCYAFSVYIVYSEIFWVCQCVDSLNRFSLWLDLLHGLYELLGIPESTNDWCAFTPKWVPVAGCISLLRSCLKALRVTTKLPRRHTSQSNWFVWAAKKLGQSIRKKRARSRYLSSRRMDSQVLIGQKHELDYDDVCLWSRMEDGYIVVISKGLKTMTSCRQPFYRTHIVSCRTEIITVHETSWNRATSKTFLSFKQHRPIEKNTYLANSLSRKHIKLNQRAAHALHPPPWEWVLQPKAKRSRLRRTRPTRRKVLQHPVFHPQRRVKRWRKWETILGQVERTQEKCQRLVGFCPIW